MTSGFFEKFSILLWGDTEMGRFAAKPGITVHKLTISVQITFHVTVNTLPYSCCYWHTGKKNPRKSSFKNLSTAFRTICNTGKLFFKYKIPVVYENTASKQQCSLSCYGSVHISFGSGSGDPYSRIAGKEGKLITDPAGSGSGSYLGHFHGRYRKILEKIMYFF
jgi:hypothetical protein